MVNNGRRPKSAQIPNHHTRRRRRLGLPRRQPLRPRRRPHTPCVSLRSPSAAPRVSLRHRSPRLSGRPRLRPAAAAVQRASPTCCCATPSPAAAAVVRRRPRLLLLLYDAIPGVLLNDAHTRVGRDRELLRWHHRLQVMLLFSPAIPTCC
jgi:hypothetical protein